MKQGHLLLNSGQPLFGTDGVRGRANTELTPQLAFDLARSAGEGIKGAALIGRDTRRSGPMLSSALHAGFNAVGVDTVDVGVIPVGAVSRLARDIGAACAVMVSASHNPAPDNGIKFFGPDGAKLSDEREAGIEERLRRGPPFQSPGGAAIGIQTPMADATDRYVTGLADSFNYSLRGMEFVLDCANGASHDAAPRLFRKLGATVEVHADHPDGTNINLECGATHPEFLARHVNGRIGFAFDGDADRLIAVDEDGVPANGDVLIAIFAKHLKETGKLKKDTVVVTVMANLGFRRAMDGLGIEVLETRVGDRYVLEEMRRSRAVLGGEQSGHIILSDRATGDGLRSALQLATVVAATGRELRDLRMVMTTYPQILENITVADKAGLDGSDPVWAAVRRAERALGSDGRILVRASGTEPLVRVMVEATEKAVARSVARDVAGTVNRELN